MNSQSLQHLFHCALLYSHGVMITKINTARLNRTAKTENMAHCGRLPMRAAINCTDVMNLLNCLNVITAISNHTDFSPKN